MHYTAMAGMRLDPLCFDVSRFVEAEPALSRNALALLATVIAFGVSASFLLSLVPDENASGPGFAVSPEAIASASGSAMSISVGHVAASVQPQPGPPASRSASPEPIASVRIEKDGRVRLIQVQDIYAIRANAHYTFIHDGTQEYFCNRSISALEADLDPSQFMRVHRSSVVRLACVSRPGERVRLRSRTSAIPCAAASRSPAVNTAN